MKEFISAEEVKEIQDNQEHLKLLQEVLERLRPMILQQAYEEKGYLEVKLIDLIPRDKRIYVDIGKKQLKETSKHITHLENKLATRLVDFLGSKGFTAVGYYSHITTNWWRGIYHPTYELKIRW